jgi:hypothetical protein
MDLCSNDLISAMICSPRDAPRGRPLAKTSSEPSALSRGEARLQRRGRYAPLTGLAARKTKLGKRSTAHAAQSPASKIGTVATKPRPAGEAASS